MIAYCDARPSGPALHPGLACPGRKGGVGDMKAWLVDTLGRPPRLADLPRPVPGPGEALLRVAAAGLNFAVGASPAGRVGRAADCGGLENR